jgi:hypothetical protein
MVAMLCERAMPTLKLTPKGVSTCSPVNSSLADYYTQHRKQLTRTRASKERQNERAKQSLWFNTPSTTELEASKRSELLA